ncbi:hypothetical protein M419DRAFT_119374 [Trichoderma reesei RUT C-30]|uniref:Uncharacterized protein n=1 Tax=Hypocrea jecorina (strain ATCC 56765 / BCRC 32924 / NRRL 11460 / Rut C-30) TaxID=1344414 RepID=A0A024S9M1_HYPJR|nr:hypothetical protein M419DRAFT_119374 [Trichoderma reesei RUT C-30]
MYQKVRIRDEEAGKREREKRCVLNKNKSSDSFGASQVVPSRLLVTFGSAVTFSSVGPSGCTAV